MGDLQLLGIEKRNEENEVVGTRPIGIPSVLRRLAGRVLMQAYSEAMGEFFTTTPVPPERSSLPATPPTAWFDDQ